MDWPLRIECGISKTPLPVSRPVFLRAFHVSLALTTRRAGGFVSLTLPVAVTDGGSGVPRTHPVIDFNLVAGLLAAAKMGRSSSHRPRDPNGRTEVNDGIDGTDRQPVAGDLDSRNNPGDAIRSP
jgi:hypothetical protein